MRCNIITLLSLLFCLILLQQSALSQWSQTNGPDDGTKIYDIAINDSILIISTSSGLCKTEELGKRWELVNLYSFITNIFVGDNLLTGTAYGIQTIDIYDDSLTPHLSGLPNNIIFDLKANDGVLYAGSDYPGFHISNDEGATWIIQNQGLPIDTIIYQRGTFYELNIYAITFLEDQIYAGTHKGLYQADRNEFLWQKTSDDLPETPVTFIYVDSSEFYIGIEYVLYRSLDSGATWNILTAESSDLTSFLKKSNELYVTTENNGVFYSSNNGTSWTLLNEGLQSLKINFVRTAGENIILGTQLEGLFRLNNDTWEPLNEGLITSSIRTSATSGDSIVFNTNNNVFLSGDEGNTWQKITPSILFEYLGNMASSENILFLSYKKNIYQQAIAYSHDNGQSWFKMDPPPYQGDDTYYLYVQGNRLYAREDDKMYYTDDLGNTWNDMSLPQQFCNNFNDFIIFKNIPFAAACGNGELIRWDENLGWILSNQGLPDDREVDFLGVSQNAIFANVLVHDMYVSLDTGVTWTYANNGLDAEWLYSFSSFEDNVFVSTNKGLFYTPDFGNRWIPINEGLINQEVRSLLVKEPYLFAGTSGNGVWKRLLNDIIILNTEELDNNENDLKVYPNPFADKINIIIPGNQNNNTVISLYDISGRMVLEKEITGPTVLIDLSCLGTGVYIIYVGDHARPRKVIKVY
ncbi:MAG: T9SS type A sorting domain-containing protein [Bacteroidetes bacterium]|nr:T9SS type A sorting domain-containing protein [Bacteroidota bacterium]